MAKLAKNPVPKKFGTNRSVEAGWEKIPMFYTQIYHPQNADKQLVIMEFLGNKLASACWRNNQTCKVGITFLLKVNLLNGTFVFKDKTHSFKQASKVW